MSASTADVDVHNLAKTAVEKEPAKKSFSSPLASGVVIIITFLWTLPVIGLLVTSVRPQKDVADSGWWNFFTHPSFTLDNYKGVLTGSGSGGTGGILPFFINSFVITIPGALIPLILASMAAYAIAWVPFKGATTIFFIIFALQVIPLQMSLVPLLKIYNQKFSILGHHVWTPHLSGQLGGFLPVWVSHTIFALPLATFLLHNFIAQLPKDLIEAARVDGASHFLIFRKIILPLSTPAIASFSIFQFLWVWNDLLVGLTFAGNPNNLPLTAQLANLTGAFGSKWELLTSGAFVAIVVPLIVFFSLQRYFVRGLLTGSVKG
jgi:alpha-glucoside transport system permease protein